MEGALIGIAQAAHRCLALEGNPLRAGLIMAALAAVAGLIDFLGDAQIRALNDAWWHERAWVRRRSPARFSRLRSAATFARRCLLSGRTRAGTSGRQP